MVGAAPMRPFSATKQFRLLSNVLADLLLPDVVSLHLHIRCSVINHL